MERMANMGYQAVRTTRWKYIHYRELEGADELYDLQSDPYEMKNLINDAGSGGALNSLRADLQQLAR
jgi:N-acetylglucosamine-6-sulfatase